MYASVMESLSANQRKESCMIDVFLARYLARLRAYAALMIIYLGIGLKFLASQPNQTPLTWLANPLYGLR